MKCCFFKWCFFWCIYYHSEHLLDCTLWDALAAEFLERYNNRTDFGPFVLIINHARVKEAQGTYHIHFLIALYNSRNWRKHIRTKLLLLSQGFILYNCLMFGTELNCYLMKTFLKSKNSNLGIYTYLRSLCLIHTLLQELIFFICYQFSQEC
jgi:hypothetical protein